MEFKDKAVLVEELNRDSFAGIDIAFFAIDSDLAREFCPVAASAGAVCIDSSSAWRMAPDVPLVVPEVNPDAIARYTSKGIIASPAGATVQLVVALKPLHDYAVVRRVVVSTYQAVSSGGKEAIAELQKQVVDLLNGRQAKGKIHPHRIAFNCLPHVDTFGANGYTNEEMALMAETRKILTAELSITATTVRVPVFYGDSASVNVAAERKLTVAKARELLQNAPGVKLHDDPVRNVYPMPSDAAGQDLVLVGRLREDDSTENGLNLWIAADNLRRGVAGNAVQIAEILVGKYL